MNVIFMGSNESVDNRSAVELDVPETLIESLTMDEGSLNWTSVIGHLFCDAVDNNRDRLLEALDDEAILDWFGRTISGRKDIVSFLNTNVPFTMHHLVAVTSCDLDKGDRYQTTRNSNTIRKKMERDANAENTASAVSRKRPHPNENECKNPIAKLITVLAGVGGVDAAADNANATNPLYEATPLTKCNYVNVASLLDRNENANPGANSPLRAISLDSKLCLGSKNFNRQSMWERKLKRIHIEFDNLITLIVYEGASNCRRKLSDSFTHMNA